MTNNNYTIEYTHLMKDPDHIYLDLQTITLEAKDKTEALNKFNETYQNSEYDTFYIDNIQQI